MADNPLHKSVAPSKSMGNPLMSPDGPGPVHGTHHYADSFKRPINLAEVVKLSNLNTAAADDPPPDLPTAA